MRDFIQADATRLPFADKTFDMVFTSPPRSGGSEFSSSVIDASSVDAEFVKRSDGLPNLMLGFYELRAGYEPFADSFKADQLLDKTLWDSWNLKPPMSAWGCAKERAKSNSLRHTIEIPVSENFRAFSRCDEFFVRPIWIFFGVPGCKLAISLFCLQIVEVKNCLGLLVLDLQEWQQQAGRACCRFVADLPFEKWARVSSSWFCCVDEPSEQGTKKLRDLGSYLPQ